MKYLLFDLDGTITDPKQGITKGIQYALKDFNIHVEDLDTLCKFIGPPLRPAFKQYYGFNDDEAEKAVAKYREYYSVTGLFENEVFPGMEKLLSDLKKEGKILIVATSKPEEFAKRILEHFGLDEYFTDICGATLDGSRGTKEEVIRYALKKNGITDLNEVVMIGDRLHDVEGAKAVGLTSVGVLFGYGSREELLEAGADQIAQTVESIYPIVMKL